MGEPAGDEVVMVPNAYKRAITQARSNAGPPAADIAAAVDGIMQAMDAGAWHSTVADQFYEEAAGQRTTVRTVRDNSLGAFDEALARPGMTEMVPETSWYARWNSWGGY